MSQDFSLINQFLIAMPTLDDPNFFQGVTYIFDHNDQGAMGIMINRPMDLTFAEIFSQFDIECTDPSIKTSTFYYGGPVQNERGFIIHSPQGNWETTLSVTEDIAVSSSLDILTAIASGQGPAQYLIALGYAGWGAGQLEEELANNAWLSVPANEHILFHTPNEQRWEAAAASGGIDLSRMSGDIGHA